MQHMPHTISRQIQRINFMNNKICNRCNKNIIKTKNLPATFTSDKTSVQNTQYIFNWTSLEAQISILKEGKYIDTDLCVYCIMELNNMINNRVATAVEQIPSVLKIIEEKTNPFKVIYIFNEKQFYVLDIDQIHFKAHYIVLLGNNETKDMEKTLLEFAHRL